jgi:hypothetical protein
MSGACSTHGIDKKFVQNFDWNKPLGRPRRKLEDNIRMDVKEIMWENVDWIHLAQDRDRWPCDEPYGSTKGEDFLDYLSLLSASQGLRSMELFYLAS